MAKDLFHVKDRRDRAEIAAYLRQIAEKLEAGDPVTLSTGEQSVELVLPEYADFEVQVEEERSFRSRNGVTSLEMEIKWSDDQDEPRDLEII